MSGLDLPREAFFKEVNSTLDWLGATEALWLAAPPATQVRTQLKVPQLEALYESAFLRVFTFWEEFLEDSTVRLIARAKTNSYVPVAPSGRHLHRTMSAARTALYNRRDFLLWHDPDRAADRVAGHLSASPVEIELRARRDWLLALAQVRHRIAHGSDDAEVKFRAAALKLTGTTHRARPGRLLRAATPTDPLNPKKWILVFCEALQECVSRIAG